MDELRPAVGSLVRRARCRAAGLLVLGSLLAPACGSGDVATLSQTFDSPESAAAAVLAGLAARDSEALLDLAVDEHEFRQVVWPELPSSRPEVNLPVEYAWSRLNQNSRAQLAMTLNEHGGRRYRLVSLEFDGDTTQYPTFRVHRKTRLTIRDPQGTTHDVQLFGSLLERNGTWKVFSYVVD